MRGCTMQHCFGTPWHLNISKLALQGLGQPSSCQRRILQTITTPTSSCTISRMKESIETGRMPQNKWIIHIREYVSTHRGFRFVNYMIWWSIISSSCLTGVKSHTDLAHLLCDLRSCAEMPLWALHHLKQAFSWLFLSWVINETLHHRRTPLLTFSTKEQGH